ncbi:unnamed protein product, partial [Closterium sp. Naga37s-1]
MGSLMNHFTNSALAWDVKALTSQVAVPPLFSSSSSSPSHRLSMCLRQRLFFNKEDKAFPLLVDDVSGAKAELTKLGVTVAMVDGIAAGESVREEFKAYGDMPNFVLVRDGVFRPIRGYPESDELITFVKKRLGLSVTHLSASEKHTRHTLCSLLLTPSPSPSCTPSSRRQGEHEEGPRSRGVPNRRSASWPRLPPRHARRQPRLLGRLPVGPAGVHCGVPVGVRHRAG